MMCFDRYFCRLFCNLEFEIVLAEFHGLLWEFRIAESLWHSTILSGTVLYYWHQHCFVRRKERGTGRGREKRQEEGFLIFGWGEMGERKGWGGISFLLGLSFGFLPIFKRKGKEGKCEKEIWHIILNFFITEGSTSINPFRWIFSSQPNKLREREYLFPSLPWHSLFPSPFPFSLPPSVFMSGPFEICLSLNVLWKINLTRKLLTKIDFQKLFLLLKRWKLFSNISYEMDFQMWPPTINTFVKTIHKTLLRKIKHFSQITIQ